MKTIQYILAAMFCMTVFLPSTAKASFQAGCQIKAKILNVKKARQKRTNHLNWKVKFKVLRVVSRWGHNKKMCRSYPGKIVRTVIVQRRSKRSRRHQNNLSKPWHRLRKGAIQRLTLTRATLMTKSGPKVVKRWALLTRVVIRKPRCGLSLRIMRLIRNQQKSYRKRR